jgi:HAD superfamily hydrolase (TIGR01458 family)
MDRDPQRRRVDAVLLDIDGVIVTSWEPIPGAVEAVAELRDRGPVRFVTNTTSRSAADVAGSLRAAGVDLDDRELVTAGVATAELLRREHPGATCLVMNDGSNDDLTGIDVVGPSDAAAGSAGVVVIGSGGPSFGWDAVNTAVRAIEAGAALVAMHGSMVWATAGGTCVDGGAYARLLEAATGVAATVVGKPAPALFLEAAASMGVEPQRVAMVGDDVHSDVLAARAVGMTGILVRTGKFRPALLEGLDPGPDAVVGSLADVPALLGRRGGRADRPVPGR